MTDDGLVARLRAAGCVFAEDEARLLGEAAAGEALETLVRRRLVGEPLEHVLGWVDFAGLRVRIGPGVFIPRQRTTYLVELAAETTPAGGVVLDLCCGTGALGLAVAARVEDVELHAVDVEPAAVAWAERNLDGVGDVHEGDLTAPLPRRLRGAVDVIVANVPYVPSAEVAGMPVDSRDHEPLVTVDGGPDGLDVLRRVASAAADWLAPGGRVFVEIGRGQTDAALASYESAGLAAHIAHDDQYDATVVCGRRPAA